MLKEKILNLIEKSVQKEQKNGFFLKFDLAEIKTEIPENNIFGDYSTNIALLLGKIEKKNPMEVANVLLNDFNAKKLDIFEKIEIKEPGFINFFVSKKYLFNNLKNVLQKKDYGFLKPLKGKKIIIEFTDPNPFKLFHIGHLYSNIVGESLCKLIETLGATVRRANYQGDVGLHVAKAIWGFLDLKERNPKEFHPEDIEDWARSYMYGAQMYEEDKKAKEEIIIINKELYKKSGPKINELYRKGRKLSLDYFEKIYKRLGVKFDYYYFESEVADFGKKIVKDGLEKGIFKKSEGAIIFPGEDYGLHNRVFVNSQDLPTYEAKELGLAITKYKKFKYDKSIIITGNEVNEYFKVLIMALMQIDPVLGGKTFHIGHGMVRLSEGKMGSRTGNVVTAESLLEDTKSLVFDLIKSSTDFLPKEKEDVIEKITMAAVKYSLLKTSIGQDIVFDFKTSLNIKGNSGPYLQYSAVRCKSLIKKAKYKVSADGFQKEIDFSKEELSVLRRIIHFPEIVAEAAQNYSPNIICNFAFQLAQEYNVFYNTNPILNSEKEVKNFRLFLTSAVLRILEKSLYLLGIPIPEKM